MKTKNPSSPRFFLTLPYPREASKEGRENHIRIIGTNIHLRCGWQYRQYRETRTRAITYDDRGIHGACEWGSGEVVYETFSPISLSYPSSSTRRQCENHPRNRRTRKKSWTDSSETYSRISWHSLDWWGNVSSITSSSSEDGKGIL